MNAYEPEPIRYRLLPTIGSRKINQSWHIIGTYQEAMESATESYKETEIPVAVCEAPLDGIVRHLITIPSVKEQRALARANKKTENE